MHVSYWNCLWPPLPSYCALFQSMRRVKQSASLSLQLNVAPFPNSSTQRWFGTTEVLWSTGVCQAITAGGEATHQFVATQGCGSKLHWSASVSINGWGMWTFEIMGGKKKNVFAYLIEIKPPITELLIFNERCLHWRAEKYEADTEVYKVTEGTFSVHFMNHISFDFAQFYSDFPNILGDIHRKQRLPGLLSW